MKRALTNFLLLLILVALIIIIVIFTGDSRPNRVDQDVDNPDRGVEEIITTETVSEENESRTVNFYNNYEAQVPAGWTITEQYYSSPGMEAQGFEPELVGYIIEPDWKDEVEGKHFIVLGEHQFPGCQHIDGLCNNRFSMYTLSKDPRVTETFYSISGQLNAQD